jgi:prophage regulatory protein
LPRKAIQKPQQRVIIRHPEVERRTGYSRCQIWRLEKVGKFPARVRLSDAGKAIGWFEDEVDNWIHTRIRQQGTQPPLPTRRKAGSKAAEPAAQPRS